MEQITPSPRLYIVPVPVGNLKDITLRAIETLQNVDFVIAEDTRYSLKLLNHLGIKKKILSYYKPRENEKTAQIIKLLLNKQTAALITDSGTPAISDPGFILIKRVIAEGLLIESLPGPTAFVPALVVSGIEPGQFLFLGFPPRKKNELKEFLKNLIPCRYTLIFYESPRRTADFLAACAAVLGNREFALVKELSKKNETVIRGNFETLQTRLANEVLLGEMVIIIAGNNEPTDTIQKTAPHLETMDDLFAYFKDTHNISKNQLKKVLMKK